ncbi:hypothetical protein C0995_008674 [Termitomyces sp. Mi166|nr:hypothetical protein C0995_008674 [Termitomyces sp. Mi166\
MHSMQEADSFTDPKLEGAFLTAASRAAVHEYIQKEIKNHEAIIRYYKERHNALTFTCRLPHEILGTIFEEIAIIREAWKNYGRWGEGYKKWQEFDWIQSVSHVCSHWRAVALSNPNLWSNIRLMNTAWTPEMIQRSKAAPLTITLWGALILRDSRGSYTALKEVIQSDLSRIRSLTLGLVPVWVSPERHELFLDDEKKRCLNMFSELLPLLDQPAPMLECLEINLAETEVPKQLPNAFVVGLPQIKHLRLEGWSLDWKLSAFQNLKSLVISRLSTDSKPTINQLLDMLSRTPLLETLTIVDPDVLQLGSPSLPQDIAPISLGYLKHIDVSYSLSDCAFFFDHVIFSTQATIITIRLPGSSDVYLNSHSALSAIATLARRLDHGVKSPICKLKADCKMQCWKSNGLQDTFVIDVHGLRGYDLPSALKEAFWQSLYLDKLVSLEICMDSELSKDKWLFFATLPFLSSLQVQSNEDVLLSILEQRTATDPDNPAFFLSLKSLTLVRWNLALAGGTKAQAGERMVTCFDRRRKAGLYLETLVLEGCAGAERKELVHSLREYVNRVNVVSR